ncbi:hypothetical protein Daus18300_008019 [Diaporthe australafricana]|uniref:EamA domain-containing protein n=1 Tax=Diaporthe australafricana TaxID=127596 RepID=A0ABR3WJW0_9PEZI
MTGDNKDSLQPFLPEQDDTRNSCLELQELDIDSHRSITNVRTQPRDLETGVDELQERRDAFKKPLPLLKRSSTHAIIFMLGAQIFSASMIVSIRLLENTSTHLYPLQILFVRMSITTLGITAWLWKQQKPNNILGKPENRILLLVRAIDSLRYLNLSEATVITFMTPLAASLAGHLFLNHPLPLTQTFLSLVSLLGVLLVAAPDAILPSPAPSAAAPAGETIDTSTSSRIQALAAGLLGVCGSATAFLAMSSLGKGEDTLTVVNYFAALCAAASLAALAVMPGLGGFRAPGDGWEWVLWVFSGMSGFLMAERSLVAVNMVYMQLVFALILDGVVFRSIPHAVSLLGCAIIVVSAVFLAWHKTRV